MIRKLNFKFALVFLAVAVLFSFYSSDTEAVWQSCLDYHQYGYTGVYGQWDGYWYWYGDGCYDSPYQNYIKKYSCNGASPNYNSGGYCGYGCSNAQCNSPPQPACDANACNGNDNWYDTGSRNWVDIGSCKEKEQKQEVYRDYSCSGDSCLASDTSQRWVDTGNQRDKAGCVIQPVAKKSNVQLALKLVSCEGVYDLYPVGKPDAKVDLNDFFEFVFKYGNKDTTVDYRRDGVIDFDDFVCFKQQFGEVPIVTPKNCLGLNGNQDIDPDYNNDNKIDDADLLKFYQCGGLFLDGPAPNRDICKKFDFNNDGKVDFSEGFYDGACFSVFYKQNLNCKGSNICSDADRSGEVDFQDLFAFADCFGSRSNDCLSKFDYGGNTVVDAMDYLCLKKDFGKKFGDVCGGLSCTDNGQCGGGNYCSSGHCCANEYYWDEPSKRQNKCTKRTVTLCDCPYQNDANGFYRVSDGKRVSSKEFTKDARCWSSAVKRACAFMNKGFGLGGKEKRFEEVKRYG